MGEKFLGVDIAGLVNKHLSPIVKAATLVKKTSGTRDSADLAGGTKPSSAPFTARGFVANYRDGQIDGTLITKSDRKIVLIADSIASAQVPKPGDRITIEGATFVIKDDGVSRDPASATYVCRSRAV